VGGVRTALFNWLFARHHGGTFILRIEDTDRERSTDASLEDIKAGLRYLGLDWDEGPYFQSRRAEVYRPYLEGLVRSDGAYRCFCTPERLEALREEQRARKLPYAYDRTCRRISRLESDMRAEKREAHVVRLRVPGGATVFPDLVKGEHPISHDEIDDLILVRSDGTPTYNLVAALDDVEMGITHVIRGDDHFPNTPKQLLILRALGKTPPAYGHVPLILGPDKKPLSKRHGSTSITEYMRQGYPGDALFNFLALLGWSYDDKTEVMTRDELVERFTIDRVRTSASVFDQKKLEWICGEYIRGMSLEAFTDLISPYLEGDIEKVAPLMQPRISHGAEVVEKASYFFRDDFEYDPKAEKNLRKKADAASWLDRFRAWLSDQDVSDPAALEEGARKFAEEEGIKFGHLVHPVRAALTGTNAGPGLFDIISVLGKEASVARIARAIAWLDQ
jgi:glutamyl-tRNA synthetase